MLQQRTRNKGLMSQPHKFIKEKKPRISLSLAEDYLLLLLLEICFSQHEAAHGEKLPGLLLQETLPLD